MADKKEKQPNKNKKQKNVNPVVETVVILNEYGETIEQEVIKTIENVSNEVTENIAEIKTREENIMREIKQIQLRHKK